MKKLLPLLFIFIGISCNNSSPSKDEKNVTATSQNAPKPESMSSRSGSDKIKEPIYEQQVNDIDTTSKKKQKRHLIFLLHVIEHGKLFKYYTNYFELEKSGFVDLQLSINRLKDCLKAEMVKTQAMQGINITSVEVFEFIFFSREEAQEYYYQYIRPMNAYPTVTADCLDI